MKTQAILELHLPRPLAAIAHDYLRPLVMRRGDDDFQAAHVGHGEMCRQIRDWNMGLRGACEGGHVDLIKMMISHGANEWQGGLLHACMGGHAESIQLLIDRGTKEWNYGLFGACEGNKIEPAKLMLSRGATNADLCVDLCMITINIDLMMLLIDHSNMNRDCALALACRFNRQDAIPHIIARGAAHCSQCGKAARHHLPVGQKESDATTPTLM